MIYGGASFPSTIEIINGGVVARDEKITEDIERIKKNDPTSEIMYNGKGPRDALIYSSGTVPCCGST